MASLGAQNHWCPKLVWETLKRNAKALRESSQPHTSASSGLLLAFRFGAESPGILIQ